MKKLEIISFSNINEQEWTSFHTSCSDPVLFYQYPFLRAYQKTTGEEIDVLIFKENVIPLIMLPGRYDRKKKLFYNLTFLGWDNLNFLMAFGIEKDDLNCFFSELFKIVDLVIYNNISQASQQTIAQHTDGSIAIKKFRCPFISLPPLYLTYLESVSISFKKKINRFSNVCERNGVVFRFLSNSSKKLLEDAFVELNRLHAMRMEEIETESKFLKYSSQRFHKLLRGENKSETLLMIQAVKDDRVIGTIYGFTSSDRYGAFASGIDPNYSKFSLGTIMISKVVKYLISNNYKYFDFLRGTEDYKYSWTQATDQNYTVYSYSNIIGKSKALKFYWQENKERLGRKKTLLKMRKFL